MRTCLFLVSSLVLVLGACNTRETPADTQARVRNQPPPTCSQEDFAKCPEIAFESCPDGQEPVIDYGSDCCPIFSCQPLCIPDGPCNVGPAPLCPAGTKLWIGTALEDCCPAYRCEPDVQCDPGRRGPCPLGMPYCGPNIEPIVVGYTPECCPIYQCPCDVPVYTDGQEGDVPVVNNPDYCGCTYAPCAPGTQMVCEDSGVCGYPCKCVPIQGECLSDADCPQPPPCDPNDPTTDCSLKFRCDTSVCLPPPGCDPASGMACPAVCAGVCVADVGWGCRSDAECPFGQRCEMQCAGWACAYDPSNPEACVCPEGDANCKCDENGCYTEECFGQCVPDRICDGTCAVPACPDAKEVGVDECGCPIYVCGSQCTPSGEPCPPNMIYCGPDVTPIVAGYTSDCCPFFCCPDATGKCAEEPRPL